MNQTEESYLPGDDFERRPVPKSAQKGNKSFWGMYAGEHAAGTEFMIGPLFLAAGASLSNLILGLLIGNILAVLTWRYLVVPIAMDKRLTLYYQLERIAGSNLVKFYNVINGILFCFLAGCMITVSASAVGVPFGINYETPATAFGLGSGSFTALVIVVGAVIAVVAAAGYDTVSRFANVAAPWMIVIFAGCGLVSLQQMGANNMAALSEGKFWTDAIIFVTEKNGPQDFGLGKIILFGWLCNGAMHLGMADLSIFRFAKNKSSGWAPSIGMFLGHYMAWICAALLLAALIKTNPAATLGPDGRVVANPGQLAWFALGWAGVVCVIVAGWTTANPTIYRAGLAFQAIIPGSKRLTMTLIAGGVATLAGIFPNLSAQLLGFVGTYGTILGPMGAIICVDFWLMKRLGLRSDAAAEDKSTFSLAVALAWLVPVTVALFMIFKGGAWPIYTVIPCWIASAVLYIVFSKLLQRKAV